MGQFGKRRKALIIESMTTAASVIQKKSGQKILGIDPGLATIGFGLLTVTPATDVFSQPHWGTINTPKDKSDGERLCELYHDLSALIDELEPDVVAVEKIFFFKNAKTLVPVSQARGVILLVLSQKKLPYFEYTPMQVKQALTGYGKAEKQEVQAMLVELLSLDRIPKPDDAADALAMAVCHYQLAGRFGTVPIG